LSKQIDNIKIFGIKSILEKAILINIEKIINNLENLI